LWYAYVKMCFSRNKLISFRCNICGKINQKHSADIYDRERPSCDHCGSNMRARAIVDLLTKQLFGESKLLSSLPENKEIKGLGMSDWPVYSTLLAEKFDFTTTYYHKEPKLDITNVDSCLFSKFDFVISSEVFEHINPPVSQGFINLHKMLKPNGFCIFTVPFINFETTLEYYPDLYDYKICQEGGQPCLVNTTSSGDEQLFHNLNFHGGDGATLELRCFGRSSLRAEFATAGFKNIVFHKDNNLDFGIKWVVNWSLPVMATG